MDKASYNECTANPSLDKATDYKVTAAFDVGTTYSGYAWSTKFRQEEIIMNSPWGHEYTTQTYKTPSAILTDKYKNFLAYGYQAKREYNGKANHLFDQNLKMELYNSKKAIDDIEVTSRDGKLTMSLLRLITMSIKYMYGHFIEALNVSHVGLNENVVRVVLTVPAIWAESAKDFMKRAAHKAGINQNRLILALEPEAASLHCRTLTPTELQSNKGKADIKLPNGTRYIVLDNGGGTVDISVHEVVDVDSVKEIHSANGGPWGGGKVNEEFEKMLRELLGRDFIDDFKLTNPRDWFDINTNFEFIKRTFLQSGDYTINLPYCLIKAYDTRTKGNDIEQHINRRKIAGYEFYDGRLRLSKNLIEGLFKSSIDKIVCHIQTLWKNSNVARVKYAFMVGGFSECGLLFKKVADAIDKLNPGVQIIRPTNSGTAVLKGAVQFGHNPNAIKSRISRMTYGIGVMRPYDSKIHKIYKQVKIDGETKCTDIFSVMAKKNEAISVGEKRIFTIFPHCKSATSFCSSIYAIDSEDVMYTTDPGVQTLATLDIVIPDNYLEKYERPVKHYVFFGGTELHVRIEDDARPDGDSHEAKIQFECDSE